MEKEEKKEIERKERKEAKEREENEKREKKERAGREREMGRERQEKERLGRKRVADVEMATMTAAGSGPVSGAPETARAGKAKHRTPVKPSAHSTDLGRWVGQPSAADKKVAEGRQCRRGSFGTVMFVLFTFFGRSAFCFLLSLPSSMYACMHVRLLACLFLLFCLLFLVAAFYCKGFIVPCKFAQPLNAPFVFAQLP